MPAPQGKLHNHLILHIIILFWAYTGLIGHILPWPAEVIVWYRMVIAAGVLSLFLAARNQFRGFRLPEGRDRGLAALAGVTLALHWWCFFASIKLSSVSVGLICLSATPLLTSLLQSLIYRKLPAKHELILSSLTIAGLCFIFNMDLSYTKGILTGLLSAFLDAAFNITNSRLSHAKNPVVISWFEICCGSLLISVLLLVQGMNPLYFMPSTPSETGSILFLGVVCTAVAIVACLYVMRELSAYTVSLTVNLEPVYGIILAIMIRGQEEIMPPGFYIGGLLILSSIACNTWITSKPSVKNPDLSKT